MNQSGSVGWSLLLALVAFAILVEGIALTSGNAEPLPTYDPGRTLTKIAANPRAYDDLEQVVTGTVSEVVDDTPKRFRGAFVLAGAHGGRLLVIPPPGHHAALRVGDRVDVRGIVRAGSSSQHRRKHATAMRDLLDTTDSQVMVKAMFVRRW